MIKRYHCKQGICEQNGKWVRFEDLEKEGWLSPEKLKEKIDLTVKLSSSFCNTHMLIKVLDTVFDQEARGEEKGTVRTSHKVAMTSQETNILGGVAPRIEKKHEQLQTVTSVHSLPDDVSAYPSSSPAKLSNSLIGDALVGRPCECRGVVGGKIGVPKRGRSNGSGSAKTEDTANNPPSTLCKCGHYYENHLREGNMCLIVDCASFCEKFVRGGEK